MYKYYRENPEEIKVREYICKYIKELQRHFDMPDKKMRLILYQVYKDLGPFNFVKNWFCMIKSSCMDKIKELKWR